MMMVKKLFLAFLALIITAGFCTPTYAMAANPENEANTVIIRPYWTFIHIVYNWMDINASGNAEMVSDIEAYSGTDQVSITAHLQRYQNGSWSTIKTWSQTYQGDSGSWSDTWYVYQGYLYRLQTYFGAYDNYCWEYTTLTSGTVSY